MAFICTEFSKVSTELSKILNDISKNASANFLGKTITITAESTAEDPTRFTLADQALCKPYFTSLLCYLDIDFGTVTFENNTILDKLFYNSNIIKFLTLPDTITNGKEVFTNSYFKYISINHYRTIPFTPDKSGYIKRAFSLIDDIIYFQSGGKLSIFDIKTESIKDTVPFPAPAGSYDSYVNYSYFQQYQKYIYCFRPYGIDKYNIVSQTFEEPIIIGFYSSISVILNDKLYLVSSSASLNRMEIYDFKTKILQSKAWSTTIMAGCISVFNNTIYIFSQNKGVIYNIETDIFKVVDLSSIKTRNIGIVQGSLIYIISSSSNICEVYQLMNNNIELVKEIILKNTNVRSSSVLYNNKIYLPAETNTITGNTYNMDVLDLSTDTSSTIKLYNKENITMSQVVNGKIYLFSNNKIEIFDIENTLKVNPASYNFRI